MATLTKPVLQALQTTARKGFEAGMQDTPAHKDVLAMTVPSTTAINTYAWMKQIPQMREWIGPRVLNSLESNAYQLANRQFELTLSVPRTDIADDQLGLFRLSAQDVGRQTAYQPTKLVLEAIDNGFTENSFDGVPFFSATHDLDPAGNQSNLTSASGGIAVLNRTNWIAVRTAMQSLTGEDGRPLAINPDTVFISPDLIDDADVIFNNGLIGGGNTNQSQGQARYYVIPEWAGRNDWMCVDSSKSIKPFIYQDREAPNFVSKFSMSDENVFYRDEYVWGSQMRGAAGYGPWWLCHYVQNTA